MTHKQFHFIDYFRLIGICVYNTVVMCTVGVTVSMAIKGSATVTYVFQVVCVLFCASGTLLLIFVPKVRPVTVKYIFIDITAKVKKAHAKVCFKL